MHTQTIICTLITLCQRLISSFLFLFTKQKFEVTNRVRSVAVYAPLKASQPKCTPLGVEFNNFVSKFLEILTAPNMKQYIE